FVFKQKTAYELETWLEFRRVLFRSMFGLPAAAYAIYRQARPERKKVVGGLMLSAGLTSFLTGITEPLEFSFLFVAPVLYGIHVRSEERRVVREARERGTPLYTGTAC